MSSTLQIYKKRKVSSIKKKKESPYATKAWVERRYADHRQHNVAVSTVDWQANNIVHFQLGAGINKGDSVGERQSNEIFYKGCTLEMRFDNTLSTHRVYLRVLLVEDKTPQFTNLAENMFEPSAATATPTDLTATDNFDLIKSINKHRYNVYSDKVYEVGPLSAEDGYHDTLLIKKYFKVNRKITYTTETDLEDKTRPNLYLLFFARNNLSANWAANGVQSARLYREHYIG